jgi:hypothetical protein
MAHKLNVWATPDQAQIELNRRLKNAIQARIDIERGWREAERIVFTIQNVDETGAEKIALGDGTGVDDAFTSQPRVSVNTSFKNYRFLHSQMSANPPSVVCRPTSGDLHDIRAADAADRLIRYAIRKHKLQEVQDRATGHALLYGTSFVKTFWNPDLGDVLEFNPETGDILTEGEIDFCVPIPWNIFVDPDAETWEKARFVFERMYLPYDTACLMFPDKQDLIDRLRKKSASATQPSQPLESEPQPTFLKQHHFDVIEIYQYWEKGLPINGMQGRFCYCSGEGELLSTEVVASPFRFAPLKKGSKLGDNMEQGFEIAYLPYSILTDIDNPTSIWGRSTVVYQSPLQDIHNALMNTMIENARAHGVARLLMHEDTAIADDSITNSPYDIVRWTGSREPSYQAPMALPAVINDLVQLMGKGIDDMAGVNESMFGQQSREQSGFSMQYATNQGNMIRRRLFNKYTLLVESMFKNYLSLVRKHWDVEHTIYVLGKEKAFEALDIKGADIQSGFDLVVEYGASLSLDPVSRRQELITMMPLFEKAGVDPRNLLRLVKLSELEGAYDIVQLAADRQQEVFDEMLATGNYIPAREMQDHENMLKYSYNYLMGAAFRDLPSDVKQLIERHIKEREQLLSSKGASAGGAGGGMPGAMPVSAGQTGAQADTTQTPQQPGNPPLAPVAGKM